MLPPRHSRRKGPTYAGEGDEELRYSTSGQRTTFCSWEAFLTVDIERFRRVGTRFIDLLGAVLFRRTPGVENVRIERTKVRAGWGEPVGFFSLDSKVNLLRTVHVERGPIKIEDSPHYAYVRSVMSGFDDPYSKEDWLEYVRIYSSAENKYVQERIRRFDELISAYSQGAKFEIAVRWSSSLGVFLVVDGFHRLACVAAIDSGRSVKCIVLL